MMILNITLFVQVINFLITYLFLHHLLFKPMLLRLTRKEQEKQQATALIAQQQTAVQNKVQERRHAVLSFQAKVQQAYTVPKPKTPAVELDISYRRDDRQVKALIKGAVDLIVKRVPRVD